MKTKKALLSALSTLLETENFSVITVNALCDEALISRTTFYFHFNDKYELLKHWLELKRSMIAIESDNFTDIEKRVNSFVEAHMKPIRNVLDKANSETFEIVCDFLYALLEGSDSKAIVSRTDQSGVVYAKFITGGMMNYLMWHIRNRFPKDFPVMNPAFYEILMRFRQWNAQ